MVTGAMGFIAKILVEKIFRVQPEVKRLYLLLRAPNSYLATQSLPNEVIRKDLFRVLREKLGAEFGCFISEKLIAVAGDVSIENLGIKEVSLKQETTEETDIVVHSAATTRFDESFDDKNSEELRITAKSIADMDNGFSFNSKDLNWMDYMVNVRIPGLVKYSNNGVTNLAKL